MPRRYADLTDTAPFAEKAVIRRHLSPHATFGDDPSGWCGCAGCDPREDCGCRSCREVRKSPEGRND